MFLELAALCSEGTTLTTALKQTAIANGYESVPPEWANNTMPLIQAANQMCWNRSP
ncbi:MAG: hypothetical protein HC866_15190 [Leptolyngbyaceae cyanobacterium RU_5_1]|nr:hypothetical protein [Leptolyngbyaceae cyanobacterium RU_5_1]